VKDKFYFYVSEAVGEMYLLLYIFQRMSHGDLSPAAIKSLHEKFEKSEHPPK